jgi:hypothetical protein
MNRAAVLTWNVNGADVVDRCLIGRKSYEALLGAKLALPDLLSQSRIRFARQPREFTARLNRRTNFHVSCHVSICTW